MPSTLHDILIKTVFLAALLAVPAMCLADAYGDARARLVAAYQEGDYPAMRTAAADALEARPAYPGALFNRALAEVLDADTDAAFATLFELLDKGVHFGVGDIAAFAPLKELPRWGEYVSGVARLEEPLGSAEIVASLDIDDFVPEGIAVDENNDIYLGSIRHGVIYKLGEVSSVLHANAEGVHWSVFGMRLAGDDLWFASAAVPQYAGIDEADRGRTGLFRLHIPMGQVVHTAILPASGREQVLGDLLIADDVIYTTDSIGGELYRYSVADDRFTVLVESGVFGSPQGLVIDASGKYLYVADYVGGIYRVQLADGIVEKVANATASSVYGIDGLYRYGSTLVGIQNGIRPHRVAAFELDDDGLKIIESRILASNLREFDEPTLGAIVGDKLFFVANSHWNRFDRDNKLPEQLSGPIILSIAIEGGNRPHDTGNGNRVPH